VYARSVDEQVLTFGVSGMLWNRSLVMYDQETNSYWSHLLGKAMDGKMQGSVLTLISSSMTEWGAWKERYPETTVLWMPPSSEQFRRGFYRLPRNFVLGVKHHRRAAAWSYVDLMESPVRNDELFGDPVVVLMDKQTVTARAYRRVIDDKTLNFKMRNGQVVDMQTGSTWDFMNGRCLEGPFAGRALTPLAAIPSYRHAWMDFYPDTVWIGQRMGAD
jgi:hypothetical protein